MRLIDVDALKDAMYTEIMLKDTDMQRWDSGCWIRYKLFENVLKEQPTIDAVPVRHGKWKVTSCYIKCSECGECFMLIPQNFCPACGARMEEDHETN